MAIGKNGLPKHPSIGKMTSSKPKLVVVKKTVEGKDLYFIYYEGTNDLYQGDSKGPYKSKIKANLICSSLNTKLSLK